MSLKGQKNAAHQPFRCVLQEARIQSVTLLFLLSLSYSRVKWTQTHYGSL